MERFRIVYYNSDNEASEAIVDAENGEAAVASLGDDMGRLCAGGLTSLGPVEDNPAPTFEGATPDTDVNEGDDEPVHEPEFPQELPSIEPGGEDA